MKLSFVFLFVSATLCLSPVAIAQTITPSSGAIAITTVERKLTLPDDNELELAPQAETLPGDGFRYHWERMRQGLVRAFTINTQKKAELFQEQLHRLDRKLAACTELGDVECVTRVQTRIDALKERAEQFMSRREELKEKHLQQFQEWRQKREEKLKELRARALENREKMQELRQERKENIKELRTNFQEGRKELQEKRLESRDVRQDQLKTRLENAQQRVETRIEKRQENIRERQLPSRPPVKEKIPD